MSSTTTTTVESKSAPKAKKKKKVTTVTVRSKKTGRVKRTYRRAPLHSTTHANAKFQQNADAYIASLHEPWRFKNCRIPSVDSYPSAVISTVDEWTVAPFGTSVQPQTGGMMVLPSLTNQVYLITAATGGGAGTATWSAFQPPQYASFVANFYLYRIVSFGIVVKDFASLLAAGAIFYTCPFVLGENNTTANMITAAKASPNLRVYGSGDVEKGISMAWHPLTLQAAAQTTAAVEGTASTYRFPATACSIASPTIIDAGLLFWWEGPIGATDNCVVTLTMNYEAVPFQATADLFDLSKTITSDLNLAIAAEKIAPLDSAVSGVQLANSSSSSGPVAMVKTKQSLALAKKPPPKPNKSVSTMPAMTTGQKLEKPIQSIVDLAFPEISAIGKGVGAAGKLLGLQIPSIGEAIDWFGGLFSSKLWTFHVIACMSACYSRSPVMASSLPNRTVRSQDRQVLEKFQAMSMADFLRLILSDLDRQVKPLATRSSTSSSSSSSTKTSLDAAWETLSSTGDLGV